MTRHARTNAPTGWTILCVDDQEDFLGSVRALLEREGHRVLTATGGAAGLEMLEREPVDLLLLDYSMPGMCADEVVARIHDPGLHVLLLTGYATERPPREMLDRLDIQGYCDKSRGPEEILLWVAVALRQVAAVRRVRSLADSLEGALEIGRHPEEGIPLEADLGHILSRSTGLFRLRSSFVALAPPPTLGLPPSPLEEESASDAGAPPGEIEIAAATGRWMPEVPLVDQAPAERVEEMLELGRDEGGTLGDGAGVLPLRAEGRWLGCFYFDPAPARGSSEDELVQFVSGQIAQRCQMNLAASVDKVTGLQTRRFWEQFAVRELRQAFRFGHPTALVRIVPTAVGDLRARSPRQADAALQAAARFLRASLKGTDLAGRGDGDELLLLLSHTDLRGAKDLALLLAHRLKELDDPFRDLAASMVFRVGLSALEAPPAIPRPAQPLGQEFFPSALQLLQDRAAAATEPVPDEWENHLLANAETSWPDPASRNRAN